jgi:hypothetical protein
MEILLALAAAVAYGVSDFAGGVLTRPAHVFVVFLLSQRHCCIEPECAGEAQQVEAPSWKGAKKGSNHSTVPMICRLLAAKWRQSHGVIAQCNSADQTQQRRGRYLLAPSLTWSPGCTPAASWAACPAATRSGIIGPSPEGSMMPASSQV